MPYLESFPLNSSGQAIEAVVKERSASTGALEVVDISTATSLKMIFRNPRNERFIVTATLTNAGTDGKMKYTVLAGFLNVLGTWKYKPCFTLGTHIGDPLKGGSTLEWAHFKVVE